MPYERVLLQHLPAIGQTRNVRHVRNGGIAAPPSVNALRESFILPPAREVGIEVGSING
jgi:hypothetical protein